MNSLEEIYKTMTKHFPLVLLKNGNSKLNGAVFCFPGAGDGVATFVQLTEQINNHPPIYGLQQKGLIGGDDPYLSIESMTEDYMKAMCVKQSCSSYFLIGHSFGSGIAIEIAKQLRELGENVAPVIMLDSSPPNFREIKIDRTESILRLIETLELSSGRGFDVSPKYLSSLNEEKQLEVLHSRMIRNRLLPKQSEIGSIRGMVEVFIANNSMFLAPDFKYDGDAVIVNAAMSRKRELDKYMDFKTWTRYIPKLRYTESPGNHATMLKKDNVLALAKLVEKEWGLVG